jgi:hypothetical protein
MSVQGTVLNVLPDDVLNYRDEDFYKLVKIKCGDDVVELMKLLDISSVQSLLGIENLFSWLDFDSEKLQILKNRLTFQHDDGLSEVKWGIRNSMEYFVQNLRTVSDNNQQASDQAISQTEDVTLSSSFLRKYPMLKSVIDLYQTIDSQNDQNNSEDLFFLTSFLENICNNLCRSKNTYRYNEPVLRFATAFYVMSGKNAYEFVRLNIRGALPTIPTIQKLAINTELRINEGDFRFDSLEAHMNSVKTTIAFASEDATAVIKKISYDNATNSFVGFSIPLRNGLPIPLHYQTDSFEQLRDWFSDEEPSPLLNIHMIQPITIKEIAPKPFLLSAYGTNGKYDSIDIIRRWIWVFHQAMLKNIRIVRFSSDGDPKYLRAMRLAIDFFASLPNIKLNSYKDAFQVKVPKKWNWYFLGERQLFLCFQDATHLCTKIRNRLLSSTANMLIGNTPVSLDCLVTLIGTESKLKHCLVRSDIFVKDRQNFSSCIKICSDDVIKNLINIPGSEGTIMYLHLLRSIIIAYIDKETSMIDRMYHAWFSVFVCRWWRAWLENMSKYDLDESLYQLTGIRIARKKRNTKEYFFITTNAYYSIEINAHQLTYLALLVLEKKLPTEAMNIYHFSSQTCEGMFRSTRSMSGTFSSVVNFSTQQFLNRAQRVSVLHKIKSESEFGTSSHVLLFPKHYKHSKKFRKSSLTVPDNRTLNMEMIEKIVSKAFTDVTELLTRFQINEILDTKNITSSSQLNNYIRNVLKNGISTIDHCDLYDETDEMSDSEGELDSMSDSESASGGEEQQSEDERYDTESSLSTETSSGSQGVAFSGMRVFDTIRSELAKSYFKVEINGQKKFIHKQTACWLLTENKPVSSNDRLSRVMQHKNTTTK